MRLKVKYSNKLTKIKDKSSSTSKKSKKNIVLNSNYTDESDYIPDKAEIGLTKLRYGIIGNCDLKYIILPEGRIELEDSWIELIILMIANVIENYPKTFRDKLTSYNVTHSTFCVDKVYGKYTFTEEENYKVYNIYNTNYYLEAILSNKNIFSAIVNLVNLLNIPIKEFKLGVVKKGYKEFTVNFDQLEDTESIVGIDGLASMIKQGIHLVGMSILGTNTKVHRLDVALLAYCNWVYNNYGIEKILSLPSNNSTGICLENNMEDRECAPIQSSMVSVYTDKDTAGIVKFISDSMNQLGIDKNSIKFKFRALKKKEQLKEWEVD